MPFTFWSLIGALNDLLLKLSIIWNSSDRPVVSVNAYRQLILGTSLPLHPSLHLSFIDKHPIANNTSPIGSLMFFCKVNLTNTELRIFLPNTTPVHLTSAYLLILINKKFWKNSQFLQLLHNNEPIKNNTGPKNNITSFTLRMNLNHQLQALSIILNGCTITQALVSCFQFPLTWIYILNNNLLHKDYYNLIKKLTFKFIKNN